MEARALLMSGFCLEVVLRTNFVCQCSMVNKDIGIFLPSRSPYHRGDINRSTSYDVQIRNFNQNPLLKVDVRDEIAHQAGKL